MSDLSIRQLCREARITCGPEGRGHRLRPFKRLWTELSGRTCLESTCRDCDQWVQVKNRPGPNESRIGGSAVAMRCTGRVS